MKTLIIVGSARKDGHSAIVASNVCKHLKADIVHLSDFIISDYNYESSYPIDDQFISLIEDVIQYDRILLLTPVYWYAMSSSMKRFMDRLTDLITTRKDLGYQLRKMGLGAIACGSDDTITLGFDQPFKLSAEYLGMNYLDFLHTFVVDGTISDRVMNDIEAYCGLLSPNE